MLSSPKENELARRVHLVSLAVAVLVCLVVLLGWRLEQPLWVRLVPGAPPTTPVTALLILTLASSKALHRGDHPLRTKMSFALASLCTLTGLWLAIRYLVHPSGSVVAPLWSVLAGALTGVDDGAPSPNTLSSLIPLSMATMLRARTSRFPRVRGILATLGAVAPWVALFGYATSLNPLYSAASDPELGISPLTSICLLSLTVSVTFGSPPLRVAQIALSRSPSGGLVRILLPVAVLGPLLLWLIAVDGSLALSFAARSALAWGSMSMMLSALVVWLATRIDAADQMRDEIEQERLELMSDLAESHSEIEQMNASLERDVELATAKIRKQADELELANESLEKRAELLEESNIKLKEFAFIASHDLKAPLRRVSGFVQLLQARYADQLDDKAHQWIDESVRGTKVMHSLIEDLLDYSRIGSDPRPPSPTDLNEVARAVRELVAEDLDEADGVLAIDELPTVLGHSGQLTQLLHNLVANAIRYRSPSPPLIEISARELDAHWELCVSDNGVGLPPGNHDEIFDLFKRLVKPGDLPGNGIGLAVCRRVAENHQGRIRVESQEGEGCKFFVTLTKYPERARF